MTFDWRAANSPLVRELGWCLFSAPIIDTLPPATTISWPCNEDRGGLEILAALDKDPRPLHHHLLSFTDKRLGARFEAMWIFYLSNHPQFELLAHHCPVLSNGQTLGALDLLFRDHQLGAVVHGEIAVKFYLYQHDRAGPPLARWIGPNPDDSLHLKLSRLASHQLPLSGREEARRALRQGNLPVPDFTAATIKGYLFHPLGERILPPAPVSAAHQRGEWLYQHDLPRLFSLFPDFHWAIAERHQWLLPESIATAPRQIASHIAERLAQSGRPIMLCAQNTDSGRESRRSRRFFVVPDKWPHPLDSKQRPDPGPDS